MNKLAVRNLIIGLLITFSLNAFSNSATMSHSSSHTKDKNSTINTIKIPSNERTTKNIELVAEEPKGCKYWLSLFKPHCHRLHQVWTEGHTDLYISGYAWHNRFTYSSERIHEKKYNELAWGGGLGKGFFDEKGNWHGLYAFAFLDSHSNVEPTAGYAYLKVANITKEFKAGLGFSVLVTARPDIFHNIPFPGAVPWAGMFYKKISVKAAYIPGSSTNGNVLYLVGTYSFDK